MTAVLWHLEISHYNEKARWALDYKGIPHERRAPMPGLHGLFALAHTRGRHRRLPILDLDGRTVADSTAIVAALEEYRPDPPLYPDDPDERARALELEDWFDEQLAPAVRRWVFHHTLDDIDAVIAATMPNAGATRVRLLRTLSPVMQPLIRRDYAVNEKDAAEALVTMRAAMDRVESEIGPSGYLVADRFSVADLAGAVLFTPVLCPPERQYAPQSVVPVVMELREELSARPGGEWVAEMFARHRGLSAEVAA